MTESITPNINVNTCDELDKIEPGVITNAYRDYIACTGKMYKNFFKYFSPLAYDLSFLADLIIYNDQTSQELKQGHKWKQLVDTTCKNIGLNRDVRLIFSSDEMIIGGKQSAFSPVIFINPDQYTDEELAFTLTRSVHSINMDHNLHLQSKLFPVVLCLYIITPAIFFGLGGHVYQPTMDYSRFLHVATCSCFATASFFALYEAYSAYKLYNYNYQITYKLDHITAKDIGFDSSIKTLETLKDHRKSTWTEFFFEPSYEKRMDHLKSLKKELA